MKKLVLIGCGCIGEYHLGHFLQFEDIELAGFCDLIPERAESFVKRAGRGKAYTCYRTMYDEIQPDMVFICIPPDCHGAVEMETIRRGIPFFVEKPVALDMELAQSIREAAEARNLITAVGFQCRYDNINEAAHAFVQDQDIVVVDGSRVGGIPDAPWWRIKAQSGGQLVEQTIHQVDILRYLLGEVESVYSMAARGHITQAECPGYDTDDLSMTLMRFKNGATCHLMTGCYSTNGASWDSKMTFGSRGARMDYRLCRDVTVYGVAEADKAKAVAGVIAGDGTQRKNDDEAGIRTKSAVDFGVLCDRTFIDAVLTGDASKIRSPYADAMKTVALTLACNKSMETGLPVRLDG